LLTPSRLIAVALLALSGCVAQPSSQLARDYDGARDALEAGDTANAVQRYARLVADYGDTAYGPGFEVEYAHALLRAHMADRAMAVARAAEARATGEVLGRARMIGALAAADLAEAEIAKNSPRAQADRAIRTAFQALGETVARHPDIDPQGLMLARMRQLKEHMARLELASLADEHEAGQTDRARARAHYILDHYGDTDAVLAAHPVLKGILADH